MGSGKWLCYFPLPIRYSLLTHISIELIHGFVQAVSDEGQCGIDSALQNFREEFHVVFGEVLQDVILCVHVAWGTANTETQAWEVFCAKLFYCGRHAALSAWPASRADADSAEGQVKIIVSDEQVFKGNLVEVQQSLHGLAREIHKGLWLGEDDLPLFVKSRDHNGFGLQLHSTRIQADGDVVNEHEADIVAGVFVFAARVAEADDEEGFGHGVSSSKFQGSGGFTKAEDEGEEGK